MRQQSSAIPDAWPINIVGHDVKPASWFLANARNVRIHPRAQQDATEGSLNSLGWIKSVTVNKRTSDAWPEHERGVETLLDGHDRVTLALSRGGDTPVPLEWVDLDPAREDLFLLIVDELVSMAMKDKGRLDALLRDVKPQDAALQQMLSELAAREGLYTGNRDGELEDVPEAQVDRAQELQEIWETQFGQLWEIPSLTVRGKSHRLLCGDCTRIKDMETLMRSEIAQMMFTDPPYGVDYTGGHFHSGDVHIKRERPRIDGDKNADLYATFLPVVLPYVDGPCYMWFADANHGREVYNAVYAAGCQVHALLIWNKVNATYAAMNAQYKQRHEPMLYFKPRISTLRWIGPSDECTVWDMPRDPSNNYHPTQKPVSLALRALGNHDADLVIDPFIGGGSTMVSAEQLGRLCYASDIEPKYIAVTLQRLQDMGLTPQLVES